MIFRHNQ